MSIMDIELIRDLKVNAKTSETCGSVGNAFPQNSHKKQGSVHGTCEYVTDFGVR
jgi:hypothetical protein